MSRLHDFDYLVRIRLNIAQKQTASDLKREEEEPQPEYSDDEYSVRFFPCRASLR